MNIQKIFLDEKKKIISDQIKSSQRVTERDIRTEEETEFCES